MKDITPYTARRRKGRIAGQLTKRIAKVMRRLPECEWVVAYRYLGQTTSTVGHEWHAIASHGGLATATMTATPTFDQVLLQDRHPGACPDKPRNAVTRASLCRSMLRDAWLDHVRGTPFEGRVQMYRLVRDGECPGFPWWDRVAGVDFTNEALNCPEVSSRVWDYLIDQQQKLVKK